ncbi:MAG: DNA/RNA nuclease SfsA [Bdellovibrio sp.]|nr:MAG: DNA/RNA nuclease SfsA [Bdellovibrio sp.]
MRFQEPLVSGHFLKRYKRFFADARLPDGQEVVVHVPNTGSMKGCLIPEAECLLTHNNDPKRKLQYTLQFIKTPSSWVGVNTHLSNKLVKESWQKFSFLKKYTQVKPEIKVGAKTRFDFLFSAGSLYHYMEVKNVTLADGDMALFPDAVTQRGQKHLEELIKIMEKGHEASLVFTVQRTDCVKFAPASEIDPDYARLLQEAYKKGLQVWAFPMKLEQQVLELDDQSPLELAF